MPELPEVEICRRNLARWVGARALEGARVPEPRSLVGCSPGDLDEAVRGRRTEALSRKGKRILWVLEGGLALCLHLGMTGKWLRREPGEDPPRFTRAVLQVRGGPVLCYRDPRLLGRVGLRGEAGGRAWLEAGLGPDALDEAPDGPGLRARLGGTRRPLKVALMDQAALAGLGNIQAAEVLWRARLRPDRAPATLSDAEWSTLARTIPAVLEETIREEDADEIAYVEEDPSANPFRVYGRAGQPCPRCGATLIRNVHGGRGTYGCPGCQE
ncbi:formamidopyrimidine-DNA glycosylase [Myxococcota bacterium]|nr:formamidopyrimidine-DNA glycosylase [Myxococcota bacterium]